VPNFVVETFISAANAVLWTSLIISDSALCSSWTRIRLFVETVDSPWSWSILWQFERACGIALNRRHLLLLGSIPIGKVFHTLQYVITAGKIMYIWCRDMNSFYHWLLISSCNSVSSNKLAKTLRFHNKSGPVSHLDLYSVTVRILLLCIAMAWKQTTKQLVQRLACGLSTHASTPMNMLIRDSWLSKWLVILDQSYNYHAPGDARNVKQCPNWTNDHFFLAVGTAAWDQLRSLNFEMRLRFRDSRGYSMCGN